MIQLTISVTPEVKEGLKRIGAAMAPGNPLSMSAVVRDLVERELEELDAHARIRPCHQDPPVTHVAGKEVE